MRVSNCGHLERNLAWAKDMTYNKTFPCFFCMRNYTILAAHHGRGNLVRKEWRDLADAGF